MASCMARARALSRPCAINAEPLWNEIRALAGDFLHALYIDGAFQGNTPEDSHFVRCDASTTAPDDVAAHRVNLLYGMAPLQAAEFALTRLSAATYDSQRPTPMPALRIESFGGQLFLAFSDRGRPSITPFNPDRPDI